LLIRIWIVARDKKHQNKQKLFPVWQQDSDIFFETMRNAKQRYCWKRGTEILVGLPLFFFVFQTRLGNFGLIPIAFGS
jgi:hypothetical protein